MWDVYQNCKEEEQVFMCEIYDNNKNTTYSTANNSSRLRKVKVGAKYT